MTMTMENIGNILNKKKWQPKLDSFDGLPVRPPVKQTRLYLDNEYFEKGYAAAFPDSTTTVYCILAKYAHHEKQICFPAAATVMKLGGITNRSTVFRAFRILEAYSIIAIIRRSKGRVPNVYALLETSHWTSLNSLPFETVIQGIRKPKTVSLKQGQQSQNPPYNSGTDETRNHLMESDKEIRAENIKTAKNTEPIKGEISKGTLIMLRGYYEESDALAAYSELQRNGDASPSFSALRGLLKQWAREGRIKEKKPMTW